MRLWFALLLLTINAAVVAQTPPSCPATRPVDDIIAEVHGQQSKKKHRNPNPIPDGICIFGWCRGAQTPPTLPQPAPRMGTSGADEDETPAVNSCDAAMENALQAAHNVDVGDYYFADKNYNGALFRYQDALKQKPEDAAIYVRLGRSFEKLSQPEKAIEQYKAAQKLGTPQKWVDEATAALKRLQATH